ncbi:unnamed protein product [Rhizophagus irregularis]|nr:unnamed protein product [Rhizophagus irregularis]
MNEFLSEEIPFNNILHDEFLVIKILNSSDLSSFQFNSDANCDIQPTNPISECLDVQLNESGAYLIRLNLTNQKSIT